MPARTYTVTIDARVRKDLEDIDKSMQRKILVKIESLGSNPRPEGCVKLKDAVDIYRVLVGDYRILYRIQDRGLVVLIIRAGHRREVYR